MASGHVSRANRPNTWPHRPMLLHRKKSLPTRSRPHMAHLGSAVAPSECPLCASKRPWRDNQAASGLGQSRRLKGPAAMAASSLRAEVAALHQNGREGPCVDGSRLARAFFTNAALVGAAMCSAC